MSDYLMEDPLEAERLEIKTKRESVLKELQFLELEPGTSVIELGCGTGAITRILGEKAFPGRTIGMDLSPHRLEIARKIAKEEAGENIGFVCSDIVSHGLKSGCFDVAYSRCTFQYLAGERGRMALRGMKNLVRSGGRVVVADVDGVCLYRVPFDEEREKGVAQLLDRLGELGFDNFVGRKLYGMFREEGFQDIRVDLLPYYLIPGKADPVTLRVWEMKMEILDPLLTEIFGSKKRSAELVNRFLEDFHREDVFLYNVIFIVQGRT